MTSVLKKPDMARKVNSLRFCTMLFVSSIATHSLAECIAIGFPEDQFPQNPIYKVISRTHTGLIINQFRETDPDWHGKIELTVTNSALQITYDNEDA